MNYNKIEELYVDFILDIIGPNLERESERSINLKIVEGIIIKIFKIKLPDYTTYLLPYGSYPIKTYLKNADIDITIFFESKIEKKVLIDLSLDLINKSILLIKDEFERYNKEVSFELFSDIKIIMADIRLLKCKIGSISLDISINNFSGLYKIVLIDYIENQFKSQFNKNNLFFESSYSDNKLNIFRRALLLIKAWCSYEGNLMGSNIGLMASYTLEILVIYVFNNYHEYIYNEFDGFEKFFEVMEKIDWEKNIISLFGIFSNISFQKKLSIFNSHIQNIKDIDNKEINEPFWYYKEKYNKNDKGFNLLLNGENDKDKEPLIKLNELKKLIAPLNKSMGNMYLKKEGKLINSANFDKLINILDPINNYNNLGKSINYHSNSKMKKVIIYLNQQIKMIHKMRKKGNPFLYINALLNLFRQTLSTNFIDLFANYVNAPRILSNSRLYQNNKKPDKNKFKIDKEEIIKFNKLFTDEKTSFNINYHDEEEYDNFEDENEEGEGGLDLEEKDLEDAYEEDEYAEEEEEEDNYKREMNGISKYNEKKLINKDEKIKFIKLANNQVIKKIFELYENKQKTINDNNQLLKESLDYSNKLNKFLKSLKLI